MIRVRKALGLLLYGLALMGVALCVGAGGLDRPFRLWAVTFAFGAFLGGTIWGYAHGQASMKGAP